MLKAPEFLDIVGHYARSKPSEDVIRLNGFSDADWDASPTAVSLLSPPELSISYTNSFQQDFEDHLGPDGKPDMAGRKIIISSRDCHMQLVSRAVLEDPDVAENIAEWLQVRKSKEETGGVVELDANKSPSGLPNIKHHLSS